MEFATIYTVFPSRTKSKRFISYPSPFSPPAPTHPDSIFHSPADEQSPTIPSTIAPLQPPGKEESHKRGIELTQYNSLKNAIPCISHGHHRHDVGNWPSCLFLRPLPRRRHLIHRCHHPQQTSTTTLFFFVVVFASNEQG